VATSDPVSRFRKQHILPCVCPRTTFSWFSKKRDALHLSHNRYRIGLTKKDWDLEQPSSEDYLSSPALTPATLNQKVVSLLGAGVTYSVSMLQCCLHHLLVCLPEQNAISRASLHAKILQVLLPLETIQGDSL